MTEAMWKGRPVIASRIGKLVTRSSMANTDSSSRIRPTWRLGSRAPSPERAEVARSPRRAGRERVRSSTLTTASDQHAELLTALDADCMAP